MARGTEFQGVGLLAFLQVWQHAFGVGLGGFGIGVVEVLDVGQPVAGEVDCSAGRGEACVAVLRGLHDQRHRRALTLGVAHLARDRAAPDQFVELALVDAHVGGQIVGMRERFAGGSNRLVRFLRVLDLGCVGTRLFGQVFGAELLADQ